MTDRYERQSCLGRDAAQIFANSVIAIVGLGGGGSHVAQQLAHIGFINVRLYDSDTAELSNLNRLIGASVNDVESGTRKTDIARRLMLGVNPNMTIEIFSCEWQREAQSI